MTDPRIGVVIATYNGSATLAATIASVRAQSFGDFVCVMVDDGSTDDSVGVAHDLGDERFSVIKQEHGGTSVARNRGLAVLPPSVEYVTFLDQDDVWDSDALEVLCAAATEDPKLVGAHGLGRFIDENGQPFKIGEFEAFGRDRLGCAGGRAYPWPLDRPTTFETLLIRCNVFPPGLVLARRDLYDKLGGFDENIRLTEDWDMLIRLSRRGDFAFVNRPVIGYRKHTGNTSASDGMVESYDLVRSKTFWSDENGPEEQSTVRSSWRAIQRMHAGIHAREVRQELTQRRIVPGVRRAAHVGVAWARRLRGHPSRP